MEWVAISSSRGSSQPKDQTHVSSVSCIADRFFTTESPGKPIVKQHSVNICSELHVSYTSKVFLKMQQ